MCFANHILFDLRFDLFFAGNERQEMLREIMRRGTKSLGTDVPSEREINRLAARSDEEYWLFEKMDEERRRRENYKSRLVEEHEVPDWVYPVKPLPSKDFNKDSLSITGKRQRNNVSYADPLSDKQWMIAMENGVDLSMFAPKKRREHITSEFNGFASDSAQGDLDISEVRNGSESMMSEGGSEDFFGRSPKRFRSGSSQPTNNEYESASKDAWNGNVLVLKTHKRRRTFNGVPRSSYKVKGQNSNSSGNEYA